MQAHYFRAEKQNSFRKDRFFSETTFINTQITENHHEFNKKTHDFSLILKKPLIRVDRNILWHVLRIPAT